MAQDRGRNGSVRKKPFAGVVLLGGAFLLASSVLVPGGPAWGQQAAPPSALEQPPRDPARDPVLPPSDEPLSDQLKDTDGVITPPPTGAPDIQVEPPDPDAGSTMPVIPPPDEPGSTPPR